MQGLGAAEYGGKCLEGGSDDIIVRILLGQTPARRLAMSPEHGGLRVLRIELTHQPVPEEAGRPEHSDIHEEVHADAEKERQPWSKLVDIKAGLHGGSHIFQSVRHRECCLQHAVGSGFHHVVAADGNGIVARHVPRTEADNIGDNSHRRDRWINKGIPGQIYLENIILDSTGKLGMLDSLFLPCHDITCKDWNDSAIHGH